eukprot:jgi/Orpsp1_1/1175035/evm.model.c7180000052379.1
MKEEDDPDLLGYNGLFDESEHGICSFYEFIYSCRDSENKPFPDIRSEASIKALNLMKKIKNEISSDDLFKSDFNYSFDLFFKNNLIFIKFWTIPYPIYDLIPYKASLLPGIKEGISGSSISGYNIGIDANLSKERLDASIEAFKYLTSKEMQKKFLNITNQITGITSIYDDEELCKNMYNCEIYKNIQPIRRFTSNIYSNSEFNNKVNHYFHKFLYGNQTASETLEQIDDITRIHFISIEIKDSKIYGIFLIILVIVFSIIMLLSLLFLRMRKYKVYFYYMNDDFWIISIFGLIMILSSCLTTLGPATTFKCQFRISLILVGYTLNLIPILYKFIINFPEKNKISEWIIFHKISYLLIFIMIDFILIILYSLNVYQVKDIIINEGKNYQVCRMNGIYGFIVLTFTFILFITFIVIMLLFCYIEWNYKEIIYDVRNILYVIYSHIFSVLFLYFSKYIPFNNYIFSFVATNTFIFMTVISSYIFIYIYRISIHFKKDKKEEVTLYINTIFNLGKRNNEEIYSSNIYTETNNDIKSSSNNEKSISNNNSSTNSNIFSKLINYHNNPVISKTNIVDSYYKNSNEKSNDT